MHRLTITTTAPASVDQQRRVAAAVAALAPNTRKAYGSAWSGWQAWAADNGRPALPAAPAAVADYLEARHAGGASPATVRTARAAVAKVHQVSGLGDPTADGLCKDVLRRIGREGRDRGRGQVAGIGWAHAEAAASLASNGAAGLQGLRDAAIVRVMSDTARQDQRSCGAPVRRRGSGRHKAAERCSSAPRSPISKAKAARATSGRPRSPRSAATAKRPGILQGRCSARCAAAGTALNDPLGADSIRAIVRRRAAAVDGIAGRIGGHSLRVGSARELAADGAQRRRAAGRRAGGSRPPPQGSTSGGKLPPAGQSRAAATRWARDGRPLRSRRRP